jgi:hypothetical protein
MAMTKIRTEVNQTAAEDLLNSADNSFNGKVIHEQNLICD